MIQDLASQIIAQFATNLAQQIESIQQDDNRKENDKQTEDTVAEKTVGGQSAPAQVGGMAFRVLWNQFIRSIKSIFGFKH